VPMPLGRKTIAQRNGGFVEDREFRHGREAVERAEISGN
jgi:hypothetical protein